ncbi:hypothetical protein FHG87_003858 [Trinorchestia longiramus]|nr:hypothetical protein FHG87_003858 [Trinorchestia longiramus]
MVMSPGFWLHGYWLLAALVWVLLLAVLLPLMGPVNPAPNKSASYKRESGVSVKEETELTPLRASEKNGKVDPNATIASAGTALSAYQSVSLSDDSGASSRKSSRDKLVVADSLDGIVSVERTASQLDLDFQSSGSPNRSTSSLADRKKLTQSGEFLSDCLGSVQSENEVEGEFIKGNTNCQVHAQDDVSDHSSDEGVLEPLMKPGDRSSCEEAPCERANRDPQRSHYAEIEKAEQLVTQSPVDEAVNEAVVEVEQQQENTDVEEMTPLRPKKANALPALDTSRASQVHCSAPSTITFVHLDYLVDIVLIIFFGILPAFYQRHQRPLTDEVVLLETQVLCRSLSLSLPARGYLASVTSGTQSGPPAAHHASALHYQHGESDEAPTLSNYQLEGGLPPANPRDPLFLHFIPKDAPKLQCSRCWSVRTAEHDQNSPWEQLWSACCPCSGHWMPEVAH